MTSVAENNDVSPERKEARRKRREVHKPATGNAAKFLNEYTLTEDSCQPLPKDNQTAMVRDSKEATGFPKADSTRIPTNANPSPVRKHGDHHLRAPHRGAARLEGQSTKTPC